MSARRLPFASQIQAMFLLLGLLAALPLLGQVPPPPGGGGITNCTTGGLLAELARTNHIFLNCSTTITITNQIVIDGDVTFVGPSNRVTLSGNNVSRVFLVSPGASLTLINITLTGGKAAKGGAIYNEGLLYATNCVFSGNQAAGRNGTNGIDGADGYPVGSNGGDGVPGTSAVGGAIWSNGEIYLSRCIFGTNSATGGNGGPGGKGGNAINNGFDSGDGGDGGNGAPGRGGAIYTANHAEINECVFDRNTAVAGNGGAAGLGGTMGLPGDPGSPGTGSIASGAAIHNAAYISVTACTFSDNRADGGNSANAAGQDRGEGKDGPAGGQAWGGAICNVSNADVINSTFSTNRVFGGDGGKGADGDFEGGRGGNGGAAYGGNFYNRGLSSLVNCTFAGGAAKGGTNGVGGAGATAGSSGVKGASSGGNLATVSGELALKSSIVARPGRGGNGFGPIFDVGYNLGSDSSINLDSGTSFYGPPSMGHLAANGGFGRTFALASHSAAIDAADPGDSPETDQRGVPIYGEYRDIGAYEFAASAITVHIEDANGNPVGGVQFVVAGQTNETDQFGDARVPSLPAGDYTITPSHPLYTFEPPSETVTLGPLASLTFTARRTYSVSGFVSDGVSGIQGVTVTIGDEQAVTGTNGFYTISGLDPGTYTAQPSAPGFGFVPSLQQVDLQSDITNVNFTAVGLLSISGRIRNESGQGLPNVIVRAGNRSATTSPTGDYTITQVPSRPQTVTPEFPGYSFIPASHTLTPVGHENGIDFTGFISFSVSGQVLNDSNSLGANAVTLTLRTNAPQPAPPGPGSDTRILLSDTNGFFSFTNIRAGTYVLVPSKTGHGFSPQTNLLTLGPSVTGIIYRMFPAFTMSGRLTVGSAGLSNATVVLSANGTELARATTSLNGSYSFENYPAGNYVITPEASGYSFTPASRAIALAGNSNNLDFASAGVYSIRGAVTRDGSPLANVTVRTTGAVSVTGADGNYALPNLPPGTYVVTAEYTGLGFQPSSQTVTVAPDRTGIDFQAIEVHTINGEVTEGAFPLVGARVVAGGVTNVTGVTGRYTLANVPAGSNVIVQVSMGGYQFTPPQQSIVLDSLKNGVNFSARGLSAIAGRVIDAVTSNGVGSVRISVAGRYETNTAPNGSYVLTNVGPGLLTVTPVRTNRGFAPLTRQVTVLTNSVTNNVDFVAFRASRLFGRIILEDTTNGIANVTLRVEGSFGTNTVTDDTVTDADGRYVFPVLRNGFYRLTASRAGQGFDPASYDVDLTADTERNFIGFTGFNISGRVTDATTLAGIPGFQINVNTPEISTAVTDANGSYNFTGLREGDYTVTPIGIGYDVTPGDRSVSLGPLNAININFTARGNLTITGRVLESVNGAGITNYAVRLSRTNTAAGARTAIPNAAGSFTFTNVTPGMYLVEPAQSEFFVPSSVIVDPFSYGPLDFIAAGGRLTIIRSNNFARLNLRALPSRNYTLMTNANAGSTNWGTFTVRPTDTNGLAEFLYPMPPNTPRLFFRTRR